MNILTRQWVDTVFDKDEYTCMGHKFVNSVFPITELLLENTEYVSINPMKKGTTRSGSNVTQFRTFLIEMDEHTQKDQITMIKNSGIPWSTMTTSASKSIHFLICLQTPLEDRTLYTAYFRAIQKALAKYGILIDKAVKDPGRFTRAPFGTNTKAEVVKKKPNAEDRVQKVLRVNGRILNSQLDEWLQREGVTPLDFIPKETVKSHIDTSTADDQLKWDWIEKYYMKWDQYTPGARHHYQVKMAYLLLRTGMEATTIEQMFIQKFGEVSTGIGSLRDWRADGDPIYVPTMEERREYYRQQDSEIQLANNRSGFDRDGIDLVKIEARPEDIDRYITVGTEYFKIDSTSDKLIPWSKTMFEKFYGRNSVPLRNYDKFGYKPDYLSVEFPYDLNVDLRTRNMFIRPTYKIEQGDWSTIRAALQHGFGEQYYIALLYAAILIAFPEAKLPAIWFVGPENKGKSAVTAIFRYLVGEENYKKISGKAMESDYTDFLGASQLVVVEEAGNWKNADGVMANLKDWITEKGMQKLNPKYGKQFESPIHSKFIFSSNNYDAIPVTGEATRLWIRLIDQEPKHKVSNFYDQVRDEMGHFVNYLVNEVVPTLRLDKNGDLSTEKSRLYFHESEYWTQIKTSLATLNRPELVEEIETLIMDFFARYPNEDECYFDLKSLKERVGKKISNNIAINKELKLVLLNYFKLGEPSRQLKRPDHLNWTGDHEDLQPERSARWFALHRKDVFDGEELVQTQYFS